MTEYTNTHKFLTEINNYCIDNNTSVEPKDILGVKPKIGYISKSDNVLFTIDLKLFVSELPKLVNNEKISNYFLQTKDGRDKLGEILSRKEKLNINKV